MNRKFVGFAGLIFVALLEACASGRNITAPEETPKFSCTANSATMRLPSELRLSLPTFGSRQPDDSFVSVSNSVPGGFAGLFIEDRHYVMTFVDPAKANAARDEIKQAFASRGFNPMGFDVMAAEFRSARWTFAELDEWYRYLEPKVFTDGVVSSDIDEKANTISFGVLDEASRTALETKLAALGASCNLVTTVIQRMPVAI